MHPFFILNHMNNNSNKITVLQAIQLSTGYLEEKGIESARTNSELMLAHIMNCKRLELYLSFDRPLKEEELVTLREFISRRGKYEPLQYILGEVEFYGLNFKVDKRVLIPRPETELLIEEAINIAKNEKLEKLLDIGTGSGNIPIALAVNMPELKITSIDISAEAIEVASNNAELNNVSQNITFINSGIESFSVTEKFDMIISNPPYVSSDDYSSLQKEIVEYEPKNAVTDNSDGLSFYNSILARSNELLKPGGYILFEIAIDQSKSIKQIMAKNGFAEIRIIKDYQNIERIIVGKLQ